MGQFVQVTAEPRTCDSDNAHQTAVLAEGVVASLVHELACDLHCLFEPGPRRLP